VKAVVRAAGQRPLPEYYIIPGRGFAKKNRTIAAESPGSPELRVFSGLMYDEVRTLRT